MEKQRTLGLQIPERTTSPEGSFLAVPKEVESWAAALPMANVGETARKVFKTIVEFNRMELPALTRIKVAEILRAPIDYISDNLKRYYADAALPLSPKNRKVAVLNRELYIEQAIAYKIFIEDSLSARPDKLDRKMLVIALHRALSSLLSVVYQSVIVYDVYPQGLWREIHRLYAYAERHRYHLLPVRESRGGKSSSNISDIYKRALLFAVSSPYRMRQREITQTYRRLPAWAQLVELGRPTNRRDSNALFIARLDRDQPAVPIEIVRRPFDLHCRQLDTHGLVLFLRKEIEQRPAGDDRPITSDELGHQQMRNLIKVLSSSANRRFVRTRLNFELKTAVGLTALHALIRAEPESAEDDETEQDDHAIDWFQPNRNDEQNPLKVPDFTISPLDLPPEAQILQGPGFADAGLPPVWTSNVTQQTLPDPFPCKTSNESAGGYCVLWHGAKAPKIKVGEIIGIQSATVPNQFGIGISRWLKNIPGQGVEVGIELISPASRAMFAEHVDASPESAPQPCLLLPEVVPAGQVATLITPTHAFHQGDKIRLHDDEMQRLARLTHLQESTGAFAQFEFLYINEPATEHETDSSSDDADFEGIWSTL